jgi:phosphate uptake regulator
MVELRKVQTSAAGSFILTLPKSWADEIGLKKGDRVGIALEDDGSIRISPHGTERKKTSYVNISLDEIQDHRLLDLSIKSLYALGSDYIRILSKSQIRPEKKKEIKKTLPGLIGTEIAEEFHDKMILQTIVDPARFTHETLIKRYSVLSTSVLKDAVKALIDNNISLAQDAYERGTEGAKLYRIMLRQLMLAIRNRSITKDIGIQDVGEIIVRAVLGRDISRLVYHATRLAGQVIELKGKKIDREILNSIVKMSEVALNMQEKAIQAFLTRDTKQVVDTLNMMEHIREMDSIIISKIPKNMSNTLLEISLTRMIKDIRSIAGYAIAIAEDAVLSSFCTRWSSSSE